MLLQSTDEAEEILLQTLRSDLVLTQQVQIGAVDPTVLPKERPHPGTDLIEAIVPAGPGLQEHGFSIQLTEKDFRWKHEARGQIDVVEDHETIELARIIER